MKSIKLSDVKQSANGSGGSGGSGAARGGAQNPPAPVPPSPMPATTSRIVFDAPTSTARNLSKVSDELALSKVKALQLAVEVLHGLAENIGQGATVLIRKADGSEKELWLPQLTRKHS